MTLVPSLSDQESQARILTLGAEARAYTAEAKFHEIQAERLLRARAHEDAELESQRIYDFTAEVGFGTVRACINTLTEWRHRGDSPITVRFLTPGGNPIAGLALFDYIRLLQGGGLKVDTVAIGMAASMGAVLLQAGSKRYVTPSTWVMIHEISGEVEGKYSEIIDITKWQKKIQDQLLNILAERSKLSKRQIMNKWSGQKDWWMTAQEAVDLGFVDAIAVVP